MKKKTMLTITVFMLMLFTVFSVSAVSYTAGQRSYTEDKNIKIIDNVVYRLCNEKSFGGYFYEVYDWFATSEAAETVKEINIVSEIDGIKVKAVRYDGGACTVHYQSECSDEHNYSVKKVTIPDTITYIGDGFFSVLDGVKELEIPASVKNLGVCKHYSRSYSFYGMESLEKVTFSGDIDTFGGFSNCTKLKTVILKGSIKQIGEDAFNGCTSLKSFKIPSTVKEIGGSAFYGSGLTSVTIPVSVTDFGNNEDEGPVFKNCKKLTKVVFADRKADLLTIMHNSFENCTSLKKVYLPKSVKKIRIMHCAFKNCKKLTKVYNTDNVTVIEGDAFRGCKALTGFTLSSKVTKVGEKAFYGCAKLKKVTFENSKTVPSIGKKAFGKTAKGIKFVAENKKTATALKKKIKATGIKKPNVGYVKYVKV